jgi:hypothetical protein
VRTQKSAAGRSTEHGNDGRETDHEALSGPTQVAVRVLDGTGGVRIAGRGVRRELQSYQGVATYTSYPSVHARVICVGMFVLPAC